MKILLYLFTLMVLGVACSSQSDCACQPVGDEVEFYLLKSYSAAPTGHFAITDPMIENQPFIRFSEIQQYDDALYQFTLKKAAIDRIKPIFEPKAFAVTVDKKVIYAGFFRQNFLSSSCDCIRIDPQSSLLNSNKIAIELGYAPSRDLTDIDFRNDSRLLATLAKAGKLR